MRVTVIGLFFFVFKSFLLSAHGYFQDKHLIKGIYNAVC